MNLSDSQIEVLDEIGSDKLSESNSSAKPNNSAINTSTPAAPASKYSSKPNQQTNKDQEISTVSNYNGVSFSKQHRKYLAQKISVHGTLHCLGYYKFQADAALAVDKGSMLGFEKNSNFTTQNSYEKHIRVEMEASGYPVDVKERYAAVVEEVGVYLSQIYADKNKEADNKKNSENGGSSGAVPSNLFQKKKTSGPIPSGRKKKLTSDYTGVSYAPQTKKWKSQIWYDKKTISLSYYELETDAAKAYDEAARLLKKPEKANFSLLQDYKDAQCREREKTGFEKGAGMSPPAIKSKVTEIISKSITSWTNPTMT